MANRRMLSKSISHSVQVNRLPLEAQLLFTWMIPHADDEGKLKGEPEYIKAIVAPMKDWSSSKVEEYLNQMKELKLIYYWEYNEQRIIEFPKWKAHQKLRGDRFNPSLYPSFGDPNDHRLHTNGIPQDNQCEPQYSISKENINEKKEREEREDEFEKEPPTKKTYHDFISTYKKT